MLKRSTSIAGHFIGQVLPQEDLREVAESLPLDSSAYVALVDSPHAAGVAAKFAAERARILDVAVANGAVVRHPGGNHAPHPARLAAAHPGLPSALRDRTARIFRFGERGIYRRIAAARGRRSPLPMPSRSMRNPNPQVISDATTATQILR